MKIESTGLLISLRPFDERNAIAQIFSVDAGLLSGMIRGAMVAKTNRALVGQIGTMSWNARLDSALGVFHWEPEHNLAAPLMHNPKTLMIMNSVFGLLATMLAERMEYRELYSATIELLQKMPTSKNLSNDYLNWEIKLLQEIGYALNLDSCAGCGRTDNLHYLSPRTGHAVCDECAAPYMNKLYKLPLTLDTTFVFLERICGELGAKMPQFREILAHEKF